jgi:hypothetical protein
MPAQKNARTSFNQKLTSITVNRPQSLVTKVRATFAQRGAQLSAEMPVIKAIR